MLATDPAMNTIPAVQHIPTPLLIVVLASALIPVLSAAITRLHWDSSITGLITGFLSAAAGFFTEWGNAGDGFVWKTAAVTAVASWAVATISQRGFLSGTALEGKLLALGPQKTASDGQGEPDPTAGLDYDAPADPDPTVTVEPAAADATADPAADSAVAPVQG